MENYPLIEEKIYINTNFDFDSRIEIAESSSMKSELGKV